MRYSNVGWTTFVAVTMVTLLTAGIPAVVQAQSTELQVNLPFEFRVGNKLLPPGTYVVWQSGGAIVISDRNGHSGMRLSDAFCALISSALANPRSFSTCTGTAISSPKSDGLDIQRPNLMEIPG